MTRDRFDELAVEFMKLLEPPSLDREITTKELAETFRICWKRGNRVGQESMRHRCMGQDYVWDGSTPPIIDEEPTE